MPPARRELTIFSPDGFRALLDERELYLAFGLGQVPGTDLVGTDLVDGNAGDIPSPIRGEPWGSVSSPDSVDTWSRR